MNNQFQIPSSWGADHFPSPQVKVEHDSDSDYATAMTACTCNTHYLKQNQCTDCASTVAVTDVAKPGAGKRYSSDLQRRSEEKHRRRNIGLVGDARTWAQTDAQWRAQAQARARARAQAQAQATLIAAALQDNNTLYTAYLYSDITGASLPDCKADSLNASLKILTGLLNTQGLCYPNPIVGLGVTGTFYSLNVLDDGTISAASFLCVRPLPTISALAHEYGAQHTPRLWVNE